MASQSSDLLDKATIAAIKAARPKPEDETGGERKRDIKKPDEEAKKKKKEPMVNKSTVNNLLAVLQNTRDVKSLMAYILRQTGKKEIDVETAKELLSTLKDQRQDLNRAMNYLGYFKWIYEAITDLGIEYSAIEKVKSFDELIDKFLSSAVENVGRQRK